MRCSACGQPIAATAPEVDVATLGFSVGDRVIHQSRASSPLLTDNGKGVVTDIAKGPYGQMAIHVLFDYVTRSGEQQRCAFDAQWFRMHPDTLQIISKEAS